MTLGIAKASLQLNILQSKFKFKMTKILQRIIAFTRDHLLPYWKTFIVIVVPLVLLPIPIQSAGNSTEKVSQFLFPSNTFSQNLTLT